MFENNYPFGSSIICDYDKGDLVYWNEWKVIDKKLIKNKKFGVFIDKHVKFVGNREVLYATVLCTETSDVIEMLSVRLKKEETN